MYQELILDHGNIILTPNQIKNGWLKHIKHDEENYLWVSNQKAFDLMKSGILPPETSSPNLNPFFEMIDAQLTTEIFGLFSPSYPEHALKDFKFTQNSCKKRRCLDIKVLCYNAFSSLFENLMIIIKIK